MVAGEHLAGTGDTRLHLVGDEEHVVRVAEVVAFLDIAIVRHIDAGLALDGFHDHGADLVAFLVEDFLQRFRVVVRDFDEARGERTVVVVAVRIVRHGDDGDGAAVEIAVTHNDQGLVLRNAFDHVTPAAGQFQGGLHRFGAGVHRQQLVVAEELGGEFLVRAEAVVIEGAGGQAQILGLVGEGLDDLRVAVTLVHGRISREKIEIAFAVDIPYEGTFAFGEDNGQWMIVMRTVAIFLIDVLLGVGGDGHGVVFKFSNVSTNLRKIFKKAKLFLRNRKFHDP